MFFQYALIFLSIGYTSCPGNCTECWGLKLICDKFEGWSDEDVLKIKPNIKIVYVVFVFYILFILLYPSVNIYTERIQKTQI